MSNLLIRDFKFSRDFRSIAWGPTLLHNLLRCFCAGIVISVLMGLSGKGGGDLIAMPFIIPVMFAILLPVGLIAAFLAQYIPFIGLLTLIPAFMVIPGDPIVWLLSILAPKVVPMDKPGFIMFSLIIWLLKSDEAAEITITNE